MTPTSLINSLKSFAAVYRPHIFVENTTDVFYRYCLLEQLDRPCKVTGMKLIFLALLLASNVIASDIQVFFSPKGGCTEAVVENVGKAKLTILVQAYSFTSAPIAKALVDAAKRGVKVQVILDKSQRTEKYSDADFLLHEGVPTFIDAKHAIAHNKIIIIDSHTILTGSFNFTKLRKKTTPKIYL